MMWGNGMGGWGMALMTMSNLLFLGLILVGVVFVVRASGYGKPATPSGPTVRLPTPQQLLSERFARGEIDEEEYSQRLRVLDGTTSTHRPG